MDGNTVSCSCTAASLERFSSVRAAVANQSRASQRGTNFCEEVNSHVRENIEVSYRTSAHHILQTIPKPQEPSERSSRWWLVGVFALECQVFRLQRFSLMHMLNEGHDGWGGELVLDNDLV